MNEFSLGSVLGRGFGVYLKNFIPFSIIAALVYSPLVIYTVITLSGPLDLDALTLYPSILALGTFVLSLIATGAMMYGTFQQLRGRPAGMGESLAAGLKRMFPVLGVGILVGLCVLGGIILLIVPGLIFYCMLWLAVPVAVVEKPGVMASLKRSAELTKGYRGSIFGIVLILGVLSWVGGKVLETVLLDAKSFDLSSIKTFFYASLGLQMIMSALGAVINAVAYHDLRLAKDGVEVSELESVFD